MKSLIAVILIFLSLTQLSAQEFASFDKENLVLNNGTVTRIIKLSDHIFTERFYTPGCLINYVMVDYEIPELDSNFTLPVNTTQHIIQRYGKSDEFSFLLSGELYNGQSSWELIEIRPLKDEKQGSGAEIVLKGKEEGIKDIELSLSYLLYPKLPLVRKKLTFNNTGKSELKLEAVDVESLKIPWKEIHNIVYAEYGRQKRLGQYQGDWNDPVLGAHDIFKQRGIILGNEAPGVTKRTTACLDGHSLTTGLTHPDQLYGFRKWLKPDEVWESPWVFTVLYDQTDNPYSAIETTVSDFTRKHMGIRLAEIETKPVFVYNTWNPFKGFIHEKMIAEIAEAAAECGIEEFVIDAGWYKNATEWEDDNDHWFNECGDWLIDDKKFPNGFKPVFDNIKSLGMKPGLWLSLGQASLHSKVYEEHPEFWTRHPDGSSMFLHTGSDEHNASGCFSSDWPGHIKNVILDYVNEYGLEYAKLDLAVVTSPYHNDPKRTGCYAKNHNHKDREESLLMNYRGLYDMFDEIHEKAPNLFIDCTFETMGTLQLIDYSMCKHAEGNWLSNFEELSPSGSLRVRNMAWWRSPAIPAASLVIGNPRMDDPNPLLFLKSLAGTLPIMLGDPRNLPENTRKEMKNMANWMRACQDKYNYMMFRQDLPGFGEPMDGHWDGFQRINTDTKSGGIVGVFRQGAFDSKRMVAVNYLEQSKTYSVKSCPDGKVIAKMTGKELQKTGFKVEFTDKFDGELYEIALEE